MYAQFLTQLVNALIVFLNGLITGYLLAQLLGLLLILLLARLLQRPLQRLPESARRRFVKTFESVTPDQMGHLNHLFARLSFPLAAWLLGLLAVALLDNGGWSVSFLHWAIPFLAYWTIYRAVTAILQWQLLPQHASLWQRQLIRPLFFGTVVIHALGLLDDLLTWGIQVSENRITLGEILAGLLIFYGFSLLANALRRFLRKDLLPQAGLDPSLTQVLSSFAAYALIVSGFLAALSVIGIPLTTFTIIAGGLSVGIGFGLQELISNFISGFILLFERSIGPGDVIQIGNTLGVVEDVGIRSMRIKNLDNVELIVPNNRFLNDVVTNFTRSDLQVRIHISVGVSYKAEPRAVEEALLAAAKHPLVLTMPQPQVFFTDFADSSLNFDLLVWTERADQIPKLSSDLRFAIWESLKANEIEIPFPQRDIHIRSMPGPVPGLAS